MRGLEALSDEELMTSYQGGNEQAFEALYRRHSGKVYGYLWGRLQDRAFADDVFQGVFMKLHTSRSNYDPSFPFVPWLFTVCRSVMVDSLRKRARIREESDAAELERAAVPETAPAAALPDLAALPTAQRKAVELRYGGDFSFEEIARRLDTSPSNARQLISRALRKLRSGR